MRMNLLIVGISMLYISVLDEQLHVVADSEDQPTGMMEESGKGAFKDEENLSRRLRENPVSITMGGKIRFNSSRYKRSGVKFIIFKMKNKLRYLLTYTPAATYNLFTNAKRVYSETGRKYARTVILKKPGNFETAKHDFEFFQPDKVKEFENANGVLGYSGKIKGTTGKVYSGKDFDIPLNPNDESELQIIVRNRSSSPPHYPTVELYPVGTSKSRSFRVKIRYRPEK